MKLILKILLPILIVAISFWAFKSMVANRKSRPKRVPEVIITTVEALEIQAKSYQVPVLSYGIVQPYFETTITPQVSGAIISLSEDFRVGKTIETGGLIAQIDPANYKTNLALKQAELLTAQRSLAEETMRAKQASQEWLASGRNIDSASEYVLRKPQLAAAKASISAAEAAINQASIDLERTEIRAPYPAMVTHRDVSPGDFVSAQNSLGRIISRDKIQLKLPLTSSQLERIDLSKQTLSLHLPNNPEQTWQSSTVRLDSTIDAKNQVSYIIAEISTAEQPPLMAGQFVTAVIATKQTGPLLKIPESALINDSYVWQIFPDGILQKAFLTREFSHKGQAYCSPSDASLDSLTIVKRPLTTFRSGTKVQQKGNLPATQNKGSKGKATSDQPT